MLLLPPLAGEYNKMYPEDGMFVWWVQLQLAVFHCGSTGWNPCLSLEPGASLLSAVSRTCFRWAYALNPPPPTPHPRAQPRPQP